MALDFHSKVFKNEEKFGVKKLVEQLVIGDNRNPCITVNSPFKLDVVIVF